MEKITIEDNKNLEIKRNGESFLINNQRISPEITKSSSLQYTIRLGDRKIELLVLNFDAEKKEILLRINGKKTQVKITPQSEIYLKKIGIEVSSLQKLAILKAPMPGLIKSVDVQAGQSVTAGDSLLVLEAMKMENVLKASASGIVKEVLVSAGQAVEKNAVLVVFD